MLDDPDPWQAPETSLSGDNGRQSRGRGCLPGCLISGFVGLVILFVAGLGVGFPNTYWHCIGYVQAFEGPDRIILFVEVERAMKWPGLIGRPPHNHAAAFLRIDVFADGRIERSDIPLSLEGHNTFNTNLYAVVRLADGFYLVENPSYAPRPCYRLGRGWADPLSPEEADRALGKDVLHTSRNLFDLSRLDAISASRGWRRFNHEPGGGPYLLSSNPIESTRLGLRLRHPGGWGAPQGAPELIVAEPIPPNQGWSRTNLIEVDTRRWTSYKKPSDRSYLRERYAASPAK